MSDRWLSNRDSETREAEDTVVQQSQLFVLEDLRLARLAIRALWHGLAASHADLEARDNGTKTSFTSASAGRA